MKNILKMNVIAVFTLLILLITECSESKVDSISSSEPKVDGTSSSSLKDSMDFVYDNIPDEEIKIKFKNSMKHVVQFMVISGLANGVPSEETTDTINAKLDGKTAEDVIKMSNTIKQFEDTDKELEPEDFMNFISTLQ
jgi:hypothetical protein